MSGPLSLKQLIAANAADLAGVHATLTAVGLEDIDLSARIATNATLIAANSASLAALTTSAGGTATQLASATAGFTDALGLLDTALTAEVGRAGAAEASIAADVLADRTRAIQAEVGLQAGLSSEVSRAGAAESALGGRIDTEVANRGVAIAAEATARVAGNEVERAARAAADNKSVFSHTLEYDGLIVPDSFPFCSGAGIPQAPGFGIGIPVVYEFVGFYVQCLSDEVGIGLQLSFEGYASGTTTTQWVYAVTVGANGDKHLGVKISPRAGSAGNVCVRAVSNSGPVAADAAARYRVTMYFKASEEF